MKFEIKIAVSFILLAATLACSGERRPSSVTEGLLRYESADIVTYSISGLASCSICTQNEIPVIDLQIEVAPRDNLVNPTGPWFFDGLGPFTVSDIRGIPGQEMVMSGTLLIEGSSGTTSMVGRGEFSVPDDSGDVVSVTLNFPYRPGTN